MARKLIKVTQECIDNGARMQICHCPIALAVKAKAGPKRVSVMNTVIVLGFNYISVNRKVQEFIKDFDAGLPVQPFNFYLDIP